MEFDGRNVAIDGLNMTFFKNEVVCVVGHNGSGKTTLMELLAGLVTPTVGNVVLIEKGGEQRKDLHKLVGYCPKETILVEKLSVYENLLYMAKLRDV